MNESTHPVPLYTIGYGSRSLGAFLTVLEAHEIAYLIDVRSSPYSRFKPEFARRELEATLGAQGILYLFMGKALGGRPDDPACYTDGKVDYEKVQARAFYRKGIARLRDAFRQQRRVVLMCSEGKPEQCHRSKLIGATLAELDIPVCHIDEADQLRTQQEVIHRLTGGQLSLFGPQTFTSRKRYTSEEEHDG